MKRSLLLALPLLAACSGMTLTAPPGDYAALPRDAVTGAGDPQRTAIISTNSVFGTRQRLAGQPALAARSVAQMEYLAVELPRNINLYNASATLGPQFNAARAEWRQALDIAPEATAQPVIDALYQASRALEAGQRDAAMAALPATIFRRGGQATLAQLATLPALPNTASAAATAQQALQSAGPSSRGLL